MYTRLCFECAARSFCSFHFARETLRPTAMSQCNRSHGEVLNIIDTVQPTDRASLSKISSPSCSWLIFPTATLAWNEQDKSWIKIRARTLRIASLFRSTWNALILLFLNSSHDRSLPCRFFPFGLARSVSAHCDCTVDFTKWNHFEDIRSLLREVVLTWMLVSSEEQAGVNFVCSVMVTSAGKLYTNSRGC